MYCEKCKKSFPESAIYCDLCGEKLIQKEVKKDPKEVNKKKSKIGLIISMVILGFLLLIGSVVFFGVSLFKYIDKMSKIEYINMDSDKIPTMYVINKEIQIDEYNKEVKNNNFEIRVTYYDNLYDYSMIDKYIEFLEENGFTCVEIDYTDWFLVKESIDDNKVILVNIYEEYDYDSDIYFTVTYEKITDDIENYVKEITYKRVGEERYGFIDIDSTWEPYMGSKDMLQYGGKDGFLSLYYIENSNFNAREYMNSIYDYVSDEDAKDLMITEVVVDNYNAYQLFGYYEEDKLYIAIWCFLDRDNIMHYIEIDSYEYNSNAFSKIEGYSVLN